MGPAEPHLESILPTSVLEINPPKSRVLDVACGDGEFLHNIEATEKVGLDMDPHMQKYAGEDITFFPISCSRMKETFGENDFDVIFVSNFLALPDSKD